MGVIVKKIRLEGSKGERETEALFDSGASMSFIKESLAKELANIEPLRRPLRFETAKSGEEIVVNKAVRLDFYLDGDRLSDEFLVVQDDIAGFIRADDLKHIIRTACQEIQADLMIRIQCRILNGLPRSCFSIGDRGCCRFIRRPGDESSRVGNYSHSHTGYFAKVPLANP